MDIRKLLVKEMQTSGGQAKLVKVPADKRPTAQSIRMLEREISAQLDTNDAMRQKSMAQ